MDYCPGPHWTLVDRTTQLICIWISVCQQNTNTKDKAGQSGNWTLTIDHGDQMTEINQQLLFLFLI